MNGHSTAEMTAFTLIRIAQDCGNTLGDSDSTPVFIFGAGYGCGERELQRRCGLAVPRNVEIDQVLASGLARHLIRAAMSSADDPRAGASTEIGPTDRRSPGLVAVIAAHAQLLRSLHRGRNEPDSRARWGLTSTELTADHAVYLKLLFPRAKFVFLHRNPLDTLRGVAGDAALEVWGDSARSAARGIVFRALVCDRCQL